MKITTMMTVFALAFCVAGCKYDKANKGVGGADDAEGQDISAEESSLQSGSLDGVTEGKFEDLYTKCTDVEFMPVYFGFDSTVVPNAELGKIETVAAHLAEHNDRVVVIEGNCDERGSSEYNMSLGENRSIIVRNYLIQNGIAAERIQTRSYGAERPAVDGHDESAWSKNRRAEFVIFQK